MAQRFDVCNGDADGLCAAVQWRLHEQVPATLVTGLKREITLLERVHAGAGDEVNVFVLSMQRNRVALLRLLDAGVRVRYFDHHAVHDIPSHPLLEAHVDCANDICTSLLVDRRIGGALRAWALVGAYGDNLTSVADRLAADSGIGAGDRARLRRLGEAITTKASSTRSMRSAGSISSRPWPGRRMLRTRAAACTFCPTLRGADACSAASPTSLRMPTRNARMRCSSCSAPATTRSACVRRSSRPPARPSCAVAFGGGGRARAGGIDGLPADDLERFVAAFAAARWGEVTETVHTRS